MNTEAPEKGFSSQRFIFSLSGVKISRCGVELFSDTALQVDNLREWSKEWRKVYEELPKKLSGVFDVVFHIASS